MRAAERALKEAEAAIRKLHESGEWRRAMEKAVAEGQGQHSDEMRKAMEEVHRAMREMHNSKEWKDAWSKAREEIRQALKSGKVTENGKTRKMTDKERQTLEKTLKNFEKAPEFRFDFKDMPKFDEKTFVMPKIDQKMFEKMKLDEKTFVMPKIDQKVFEQLKGLEGKTWVMPEMDKKAFEKLKNMPKIDGKVFAVPPMDQKAFEKLMKEKNFTFTMPKEGRAFTFAMPGGQGDREAQIQRRIQELRRAYGGKSDPLFKVQGERFKALEGFEKFKGLEGMEKFKGLEGMEKFKALEGLKPMVLDSKKMRIKDLLNSLTPEQKEKQEKQGFLTLDDLTAKQREMLGDLPKEGNWTFSYSVDGKKLTIKGK